jgi:hypothetical protein
MLSAIKKFYLFFFNLSFGKPAASPQRFSSAHSQPRKKLVGFSERFFAINHNDIYPALPPLANEAKSINREDLFNKLKVPLKVE